jgi:hypothetical protein
MQIEAIVHAVSEGEGVTLRWAELPSPVRPHARTHPS